MIIVADTTPLSELAKVGRINLLQNIFGKIIIPQEVYNEVTTGNHPAVSLVKNADWIEIQAVSSIEKLLTLQSSTELGLGECAAMILAEELKADQLLMDDLNARRVALSLNLKIIGTIGILLIAKQKGIINSVKNIIDALIKEGKYISPKLYQEALFAAQELDRF